MVEAIRESLARRGARTRLETNDGAMDCYDCSTLTAQEMLAILRPLAPSLYYLPLHCTAETCHTCARAAGCVRCSQLHAHAVQGLISGPWQKTEQGWRGC